jgi:ABC-2 type transport system permease protein
VIEMASFVPPTEKSAPSGVTQIIITAKYALLDYVRSRRFFIMLGITVLISALLTVVVGQYTPQSFLSSELAFYNSWWGNWVSYVIILSGIFFGGDAITSEFQNKTGYFSVPNPIKRSSIYIGKWMAAYIASIVILGVFTLATVVNGLYYFGGVPYEFGLSLIFAAFYLAAVLGFTFFFSSLFKSSSVSILVTAILFLFAFTLIQQLVANLVQMEPWFILTYGAQIIGNILAVPYPQHVITLTFPGGFTFTTYNATIEGGLTIIGIYFVVTAVLGLLLFERKEFN